MIHLWPSVFVRGWRSPQILLALALTLRHPCCHPALRFARLVCVRSCYVTCASRGTSVVMLRDLAPCAARLILLLRGLAPCAARLFLFRLTCVSRGPPIFVVTRPALARHVCSVILPPLARDVTALTPRHTLHGLQALVLMFLLSGRLPLPFFAHYFVQTSAHRPVPIRFLRLVSCLMAKWKHPSADRSDWRPTRGRLRCPRIQTTAFRSSSYASLPAGLLLELITSMSSLQSSNGQKVLV